VKAPDALDIWRWVHDDVDSALFIFAIKGDVAIAAIEAAAVG